MKKYISGFDSNGLTTLVLEGDSPDDIAWAKAQGYFLAEVEEAWDGSLWKPGTAPQAPPDGWAEEQARGKRNSLLAESDIYMIADYPITEQQRRAWMSYRQALRDIPEQEGWPMNIVWPEKPAE